MTSSGDEEKFCSKKGIGSREKCLLYHITGVGKKPGCFYIYNLNLILNLECK